MTSMDALVCEEPGLLVLERRPAAVRQAGEVLVRPRRVGICGTDYHIFEGKHPFLQYPRVMGHELAVEVVEAPAAIELAVGEIMVVNPYLSCGTCVACRRDKPNCCTSIAVLGVHRDGGMTELLSLPPQNLLRATGLDMDACATVEFLAIGAHAVRRGMVSEADRVLVIGAGPIGLGAAIFARRAGAEVTLLDLDAERIAAAVPLTGAVRGLVSGPGAAEEIAAATDGEGFDAVFDATGNGRSIESGFDYVAHGGRYVLVSVVKGDVAFTDADFHRKEMTLLGSRNATAQDFEAVISAIRDDQVPVKKLITHRTTLAGAAGDIAAWTTQKRGLIKAVLEMA
jgi:2-desacetyl-2-hydroxyethyl bacteriochlorophyllide A dehydrogenase